MLLLPVFWELLLIDAKNGARVGRRLIARLDNETEYHLPLGQQLAWLARLGFFDVLVGRLLARLTLLPPAQKSNWRVSVSWLMLHGCLERPLSLYKRSLPRPLRESSSTWGTAGGLAGTRKGSSAPCSTHCSRFKCLV